MKIVDFSKNPVFALAIFVLFLMDNTLNFIKIDSR